MRSVVVSGLFLCLLVALCGCRANQQAGTPTTNRSGAQANQGDAYNRDYEQKSRRHRHRRGNEAESADENWSGYDRHEGDEDAVRPEAAASGSEDVAAGRGRERRGGRHNRRALASAPGQFDYYLLNLSWSPEFCQNHAGAAECAQHRAFTLHGLWPENNDGTYPEDCSEAAGPSNPSQYADIYPDASLLQHEWQTHGTCSGLGADQFFALARRTEQSVQIPAQLAHLSQQTTLTPGQVITLFQQSNPGLPAGSVAISCGNNYLTAVEVCEDKSGKPRACSAVKSCGATQIRVVAPQ